MPTNHTTPTDLSRRLVRLALDADQLAYALTSHPMNDIQADMHLGPPALLLRHVIEVLEDAMYEAEKLDQSHQAEDRTVARLLAGRYA